LARLSGRGQRPQRNADIRQGVSKPYTGFTRIGRRIIMCMRRAGGRARHHPCGGPD